MFYNQAIGLLIAEENRGQFIDHAFVKTNETRIFVNIEGPAVAKGPRCPADEFSSSRNNWY